MSIGVMTWVWTHSRSRNGARLVLLAIADSASDNGTNAWPSIATLARKSNLSPRAVQVAIRELEKLGELKVKLNAGPNGSNRYAVVMKSPAESAPPQNLHPEDSAGVETNTEPDIDPQEPPQNLRPAESAPPQNSTSDPAESAPEPSLNHPSSSSSKKTRSSPSAKPATKRGTRIPDDFAMTPEMIAWGLERYPWLNGDLETEKFINHWQASASANAVKVNWLRAWQNWMHTAAERVQGQRNYQVNTASGAQGANTLDVRAQQESFARARPGRPPAADGGAEHLARFLARHGETA